MKGNRYYANLDFSKPIGTHRWVALDIFSNGVKVITFNFELYF